MRARRQLRASLPGFSLALPTSQSNPEVQVQQKNEEELNKFFIDVDDSNISPMVTTASTFKMSSLPLPIAGGRTAAMLSPFPRSASPAPPKDTPASMTNANLHEARFIHVDNTNIFVLIDGISMFVEGKSTFTGTTDAHLLKERVRKKKAAALLANQSSRNETVTVVDSVQEAIRDIEMSTTTEPSSSTGSAVAQRGSAAGPPASSLPAASLPALSPWAMMFDMSKRPTGARPFRYRDARVCIPPSSSPLSRQATVTASVPTLVSSLSTTSVTDPLTLSSSQTGSEAMPAHARKTGVPAMLLRMDSSASVASMTSTSGGRGCRQNSRRMKPISADDIGRSNRSLDLDEVEILNMIGKGTQGTVYQVSLDGKLYALKCIDIGDAINATNIVERQGRKKGLVKELTMINLQRSRAPPRHLMQMFNAVASLDMEPKQISILIELMSFNVENIQQMVARIPNEELMRITQSTFVKFMAGDKNVKRVMEEVLKKQHVYGSPRHAVGRSAYNEPEAWEKHIDRQTPMPELILSLLAADVLEGLEELHNDYAIVHCDLKPANVLLCYDKTGFKLADFGCGCAMDDGQRVVRRGIDLGSMLYKAPERFYNETATNQDGLVAAEDENPSFAGAPASVVEFTAKADVWSLGVMLLELSGGAHPCESFKSDFWNYRNLLKLPKMCKPLSWSETFYDFILHCVCVKVEQRWSVKELRTHPFILKYANVPRSKLRQFMERLEVDSRTFHKRQQKELLTQQILLSTTHQLKDTYQMQSKKSWSQFTAFLKAAPETKDYTIFPKLK